MTAISIRTPMPAALGELADVARLFFGHVTLLEDGDGQPDARITHEWTENGSRARVNDHEWHERVRQAAPTQDPGGIIALRLRKRAAKQVVYDALKAFTGIRPPWGSLTGIRPTRMMCEASAAGMTDEQSAAWTSREFDVSPEKASLLLDTIRVQRTLPTPTQTDVDVYVGIPFCPSRCAYCSFSSGEVGKGEALPPYVDALCTEIARVGQLIRDRKLRARAFYMGGGTPTALTAPLLARVLRTVHTHMQGFIEMTVEAGRPDSIDREKLAVLRDAGITRVSVNPQTMHDETLARIGRRHLTQDTERAYALAREMGFSHINMDLIAGLPGEDEDMFRQTLEWVRVLAPESMTVHTLCIKRSSALHLWAHALPSGEMTARMVRAGRETAARMGLSPYYLYRQKYMAGNLENVAYAAPMHACLYNVDIMEDAANILALGAGGISKRIYAAQGRIERAANVSDVQHYIQRVDEMCARKEALMNAPENGEAEIQP